MSGSEQRLVVAALGAALGLCQASPSRGEEAPPSGARARAAAPGELGQRSPASANELRAAPPHEAPSPAAPAQPTRQQSAESTASPPTRGELDPSPPGSPPTEPSLVALVFDTQPRGFLARVQGQSSDLDVQLKAAPPLPVAASPAGDERLAASVAARARASGAALALWLCNDDDAQGDRAAPARLCSWSAREPVSVARRALAAGAAPRGRGAGAPPGQRSAALEAGALAARSLLRAELLRPKPPKPPPLAPAGPPPGPRLSAPPAEPPPRAPRGWQLGLGMGWRSDGLSGAGALEAQLAVGLHWGPLRSELRASYGRFSEFRFEQTRVQRSQALGLALVGWVLGPLGSAQLGLATGLGVARSSRTAIAESELAVVTADTRLWVLTTAFEGFAELALFERSLLRLSAGVEALSVTPSYAVQPVEGEPIVRRSWPVRPAIGLRWVWLP